MSMKLRALLLDNYRAKVEQAYMHTGDAITLRNVPCEMEFEVSSGWMEHESEKHNYLPLFHLMGNIKEIHGNFPYNVSSLTFSDSDVDMRLQKEILYYMTPDELAHLITVGKFYTDKFELPEILTRNTYQFPVQVNLTIVPPPNPAAYEQASFEVGLNGTNQVDRDNLPIFYIGFAGTGIDRKKDKLFDYYGIDFDDDFQVYALTAESSGYTQPTLMEYITEPEVEAEEQLENVEEMYITPEEESEMLRQQQSQKEEVHQPDMQDDYQMDDEDILLAQADKNIERRIEKIRAVEKSKTMQAGMRNPELQAQSEQSVDKSRTSALERLASLERVMKSQNASRASVMKPTEHVPVAEEPVVESDVREESSVKEESVLGTDVTESALRSESEVLGDNPDIPQQHVDVRMDFNPEKNTLLHPEEATKDDNKKDGANLDVEEDDSQKLKDAKGADVTDVRLQTKVDEAKAQENARQAAVEIQSDVTSDASPDKKHRDVSSELAEIADAVSGNGYDKDLGVSY